MQPIPMEDFADHVRQLHLNRDLGFEEEYEVSNNNNNNNTMINDDGFLYCKGDILLYMYMQ